MSKMSQILDQTYSVEELRKHENMYRNNQVIITAKNADVLFSFMF